MILETIVIGIGVWGTIKSFQVNSSVKRKMANEGIRFSLVKTMSERGIWVKRGHDYEYSQHDNLLSVRRIKPNGTGYKIKGYYKNKLMFEGIQYREKRGYYTYHWGKEYCDIYDIILRSEECYHSVIRMMNREDCKEEKDERNIHNKIDRYVTSKKEEKMNTMLEKIEEINPIFLRNGHVFSFDYEGRYVGMARLDEKISDKEIKLSLDEKLFNQSERTIIKNALMRRMEGQSVWIKNEHPNDSWRGWTSDIKEKIHYLTNQKEYLTDEEKHLLTHTYLQDLQDLNILYDELNADSKKEMTSAIEKGVKQIKEKIGEIEKNIEKRKKKQIEVKIEVIKSR